MSHVALPARSVLGYRRPVSYKAKERRHRSIIHLLFLLYSATMVLPLLLVVSISFSTEQDIATYGYALIPRHFTLEAYQLILQSPDQLLNAYEVTILTTLIGTPVELLICALAGYALSRRQYALRSGISFYFFLPCSSVAD